MARLLWAIATAVLGFTLSLPFVASDSSSATPPPQWRDVSVLDYVAPGATPDGSHLQLALNDTARVFVPYGVNLVVTDEITVASGKTLTIDGTLTAAASRPAGWRMLRVHAATDVAIGGRGSLVAGTQTNATYGVWVSGASKRLHLADLAITGFYSGVWSPTDGQWRDDCDVDLLTITGGYVGLNLASWRNGRASGNILTGQSHVGISGYNAAGLRITGGRVTNGGYTTSASAAINLELAPDATVADVIIADVEGHAIRIANKSHRAAIVGNRISNIGYLAGVVTHGASTAIAAMIGPAGGESQRLRIADNTITTIAGYGILVHPGLSADVRGNNLDGIGDPGISVLGSQVSVVDNSIANADGYGIGIGPDPDGGPYQVALAVVTGNTITNSGLVGIMANGSPAAGIIAGNVLSGNGAGIVVQTWTWGGQTFVPGAMVTGNVDIP